MLSTCWFSGTQRTSTSATFFSAALSDVSTDLSRRTDIVAPNLHPLFSHTLKESIFNLELQTSLSRVRMTYNKLNQTDSVTV